MLLVAIVTGAQAGETFTVKFKNKNSVTQSTANYFTYNKGEGTDVSWSSKGKHSCTYGGEEYSDVIKMESATQCFFTSTAKATVTIVQTTSNATGDKLKFDGENLDSSLPNTTVTTNSTGKYNEYVITDVAAGTHTITRQSETGLAYVKVEYAAAATNAPATPGFTPNGGDVNGGSTVTIASTDAQKIFYAWTNSSEAPAQDAENTWTEASGDSYVYKIPNVTANMYLHAYGWNNYNTSSKSSTATAAFSVTKVKQPAGLAYATAAVDKYVGDANFTNALTNPNELAVTYSVVEGATATGVDVDANGEVTVGNVAGTATIKASFAGNEEYLAGDATYTLTVSVHEPSLAATSNAVSSSAGDGVIAYTITNPVAGGVVSATEKVDAEWLTIGEVGDGTIAFTTTDNTSSVSRYAVVTVSYTNSVKNISKDVMVSQEPDLVGVTIINVPVSSKNEAGTITGSIGGTAKVSLQDSKVGNGYKFGGKGNNITITLADENTFQTGDILVVHTTQAGELSNGYLAVYDGNDTKSSTVLLNTATQGGLGMNAFALPADANGKTTISIMRHDSPYNWNGYVDYVEVVRPFQSTSINLNASGFATYSSKYDFEYSGADAYGMKLSATSLVGTKVTSGKIKAGEGILFKGEAGATVAITETTGAEAIGENNNLIGTTDADNEIISSSYTYKYALSGDTFKTFTGSLAANKAFFGSDTAIGNSLELVFNEAGEATAVDAIAEADEAKTAPVKVIKNGKLYIGNFNVAGQQVK